ncbi:aBC-type transport system permease component [Clostridium sp. CAG:914]|nr:aBC-type transport system permease component [Clostridium sp. CAG:914]
MNKLGFLTKYSLGKKIKSKWFIVVNIIILLVISALINMDSIIKLFGGDFNNNEEILIIDNIGVIDTFKNVYEINNEYLKSETKYSIEEYKEGYDSAIEEIKDTDKILIVIDKDETNYITSKLITNSSMDTITYTIISNTLDSVKREEVLKSYNITKEMYEKIESKVEVERIILDSENKDDNMLTNLVVTIITMPFFFLTVYLVQMIGAEINEEKSTKSMEIIISNVSAKTHFISKIISSNVFVLIQGALLIIYCIIGIIIRYFVSGSIINSLPVELTTLGSTLSSSGIMDNIKIALPLMLLLLIITLFAYSIVSGVLASVTTNMEDYQQIQTPIVLILLAGFYLSSLASIFKGSIFIKVASYLPFISSLLAPTMYTLGEFSLFDMLISILLMVVTILLLMKYGFRIYKVGILNYSDNNLWKKIFKSMKGEK